MKTRNDFVSNSSSCSFIVYIADEKTLNHLSKPANKKLIDEYCNAIAGSYDGTFSCADSMPYAEDVILEVGDFLAIYTGEDHDLSNIDRLGDVYYKLTDGFEELTVYQDPDAHYSYGKDFKKDRK